MSIHRKPAASRRPTPRRRTSCTASKFVPGPLPRAVTSAQRGLTLLELILAVATLAILASVAYASYQRQVDRARVSRAIADVSEMQLLIDKFELSRGALPDSLADIGSGARLDPWGNAYRYLNFATVMGLGPVRKDRNLVPLNTDYDLYSVGPDGRSQPPLTAQASRDDIVRANDGRFVGKAEDY